MKYPSEKPSVHSAAFDDFLATFAQPVTIQNVRDALTGIISLLDALYRAIYKKPFPAVNMGLQSRLTF